ncbi:MAG TPA: hypothetical protein VGC93_18410, partial [Thermoanaerobaculia bacterium]
MSRGLVRRLRPGDREFVGALVRVLPDFLFALLPLLVVTIVLRYAGRPWWRVLASPEWSFGSAVLFGQALMRFVMGVARAGRANLPLVSLTVAALIVFGLVPTLLVLACLLHWHESGGHEPVTWLIVLQILVFVASVCAFVLFGGLGESLL